MVKVYPFKTKEAAEMASVFDVANYFLSRVEVDSGSIITHLKLQKLCYYAQAWHLVFENKPMFREQFQAWAHGPVCPDLFTEYKEYGWQPIPPLDIFDSSVICPEEQETLEAVWEAYGQFDGKYLEELTHSEAPWIIARSGYLPGEACNVEITLESMKEFYTKLQNG